MGLSFYRLSLDCCRFCHSSLSLYPALLASCLRCLRFVCVSLVNLLAGELVCNALSFCLPRT
jgi:hypothetical protein